MAIIPYRLRRHRFEIRSRYQSLIASRRLIVHIAPPEPSRPVQEACKIHRLDRSVLPALALIYAPPAPEVDVNVSWWHRQRTLDFSYEAQIAASESMLFLSLVAGVVILDSRFTDEIKNAIIIDDRWSTIAFRKDRERSKAEVMLIYTVFMTHFLAS